jgi:PAS domain-containing protein
MMDKDERLVVCNHRYIEMYGLSRDIVKPGCNLGDLLQQHAARGHLADPEQYGEAYATRAEICGPVFRSRPLQERQ